MAPKSTVQSQTTIDPRIAALLNVTSTGTTLFEADVQGCLVELRSPEQQGRPSTYCYQETGEVRASTWTAVIRCFDGSIRYWNWPGYLDEAGTNMPGIRIIEAGHTLGELFSGAPAHFRRDEKSHRSTITLIRQH